MLGQGRRGTGTTAAIIITTTTRMDCWTTTSAPGIHEQHLSIAYTRRTEARQPKIHAARTATIVAKTRTIAADTARRFATVRCGSNGARGWPEFVAATLGGAGNDAP